ncbi:MAG TPA: ferrous iron transport protein A [Gammaproteobacteria bacterium]|nr:ferrous iron transport protein A [Xanthomonadales bacterium]HOP21638.1 ferrous iron transport protein A [Gammaproteobacteria bacterium]MCB1594712.1 ferrous iron transport protein A [Xanthomonadales bacterium]MCB1604142.1 ferrous iron transport protein A [Xanthomonadales bacterium]HPI94588.1 ferrous iron transport protein A [Gammaproteobacteria bacterium]
MKLSQAQTGKSYKVEELKILGSLAQRMAILGLTTGVLIELLALYKHGALIQTGSGAIAIGSDLLELISVTMA